MKTKEERLAELEAELVEEQEKWTELGINLNQLNFSPVELFEMKVKLQALVNCVVSGETEEIDMNLHLKEILKNDMKNIRESIEPQIIEFKRNELRQRLTEGIKVQMPWERPNDGTIRG